MVLRRSSRGGRALLAAIVLLPLAHSAAGDDGWRGPIAVATVCDDRYLVTANRESGSVSLLARSPGEVLVEVALSGAAASGSARPAALAARDLAHGGALIAVSDRQEHRLHLLAVIESPRGGGAVRLERRGEFASGRLPGELAWSGGGRRLFVAVASSGEVWEHDAISGTLVRRLPAVEGARLLTVIRCGLADSSQKQEGERAAGERLIVAGRSEVAELDTATGEVLWRHAPADGQALNLGGLTATADRVYLAHQVKPGEALTQPQMIVWGLVISNRLTVLARDRLLDPSRSHGLLEWRVALDQGHRASGDPCAPLLVNADSSRSPSGGGAASVFLLSAGTRRALRIDGEELAEPPYVLSSLRRSNALPSIVLPFRPTAATRAPDGLIYVASLLDDTITEIDPTSWRRRRELRLGPPPAETLERRGARIFGDATRSRGGWYSCESCHPDGGSDGHTFDTLADGTGLGKKSPALWSVVETGPWSWLGRFGTLTEQVASSMKTTMAVDTRPPLEDVNAIVAYLMTLQPPRPARPEEVAPGDPSRGEILFSEADCERCHVPPLYTSPKLVALRLDGPDDDERYNPPSLIGVSDRHRYLHDARAASLEAIFRQHDPERRHGGGAELTDEELADLTAFLKTL